MGKLDESTPVDLDVLLERMLALRPMVDDRDRMLAMATYRLLGDGARIRDEDLGHRLGWRTGEVRRRLDRWPSQVHRDVDDAIVGFGGLSTERTNHRLVVRHRVLYSWCAWDTLFIPQILATSALVESVCPATEDVVRLTVEPERVVGESAGVVLTLPSPTVDALHRDVIGAFCCRVFFFPNRKRAVEWLDGRGENQAIVDLGEAFALGRRKNAMQFGDLLAALSD